MRSIHPLMTQPDGSVRNNYDLSDFKQILSNQHSKQFHLIDSPQLIFELARYKFNQNKCVKADLGDSKSVNQQIKLYKPKSQQDLANINSISQSLIHQKSKNLNFASKNVKSVKKIFEQSSKKEMKGIKEARKQKVNYNKQKCKTSKQQQDNFQTIECRIDQKQKQNILQRNSYQQRPMTSNVSYITGVNKSNNKQSASKQLQVKRSWKQAFQRKRYNQLKIKLQSLICEIEGCEELSLSQVFEYQQLILSEYLSSLVMEMKKQCLQKGELIERIWNTFFVLLNKVMKVIVEEKKSTQKTQLQEQIQLHAGYQQMYVFQTSKIKQLGKKYNESKNVIDRLIYQLRYKRKEVKKLYKNLAMCNQKLNQYKVEHIDLQNQHIQLLMDAKEISSQEATKVMRRKQQVNRQKYLRERVGVGKQKLREMIMKELQEEILKPEQEEQLKKQLFDRINSLTSNQKKKTIEKQQTHLVQDFIEKFSTKCIQLPESNPINNSPPIRKHPKTHTAINTDFEFKLKNELTYSATQTSFSDKLEFSLINTRSTQTSGTQKIKKVQNMEVQVDGDQVKVIMTKMKMKRHRVIDLSFYFDLKKRDQKVKHILQTTKSSIITKQHKKNHSISEQSSDGSESKEKKDNNKRPSKNLSNINKDKGLTKINKEKKTSIFNSTSPNLSIFAKTSNSKQQGAKKETQATKIVKKRVTQIAQDPKFSMQQQETFKRYKKTKKRLFRGPESFQKDTPNAPSICNLSIEPMTENILMSKQKQKYIQNYIMSKEQEYHVLRENSIFDTFKDYLKKKSSSQNPNRSNNDKKSSVSKCQNLKGRDTQLQVHNEREQPSEDSQQQDVMNSQECLQLGKKLKATKQAVLRRSSIDSRQHIKPPLTQNFKAQKQSFKQQFFLQRIIEFTVKKSLIKHKLDPSNFNQCKQKSQFLSITQKIDPLMLDVEYLMRHNFNKKRKPTTQSIKSTNKFIMMTYSRAIDKMYRNNVLLQNLIKPLFQCFQMIYGALKPQQIYKKMVAFISDILSAQVNQNYKEFLFFLGLDKEDNNSTYLTTFDVCLYLKLLQKLNVGGKMGYDIEAVFTSKSKVIGQLRNILEGENIAEEVIQLVEGKISCMLNKLEDFVRQSRDSEDESKINLFKVARIIVQEIIQLRINSLIKLQSYMGGRTILCEDVKSLTLLQSIKRERVDVQLVSKIVNCCRISTSRKLYFSKLVEELCCKQENKPTETKTITKSQLGILLIRIGLVEFTHLEENLKFLQQRNTYQNTQTKQGNQKHNDLSINLYKLHIVEVQTNKLLSQLLGQMETLYEITLIKNLENQNKN